MFKTKKKLKKIKKLFKYNSKKSKCSEKNLSTMSDEKNSFTLKVNKYWEDQKYLEKTEFKYVLWLDRVYQLIENTPGHIVELGVAYGRNAIIFSHLMQMNGQDDVRKYIGFDTFDGYTEDTLENESHLSGEAWKNISISAVQDRLKKAGNFTRCEFIKGDIVKTVPQYLREHPHLRAALLYVDCNSYAPSITGMELMREFMTPGGVVCIDEKLQGGETKALIEFCEKYGFRFMRDNTPFSVPAYTRV